MLFRLLLKLFEVGIKISGHHLGRLARRFFQLGFPFIIRFAHCSSVILFRWSLQCLRFCSRSLAYFVVNITQYLQGFFVSFYNIRLQLLGYYFIKVGLMLSLDLKTMSLVLQWQNFVGMTFSLLYFKSKKILIAIYNIEKTFQ